MRVTDVKTFLVHPSTGKSWLFAKVETDAGIHGWGGGARTPGLARSRRHLYA